MITGRSKLKLLLYAGLLYLIFPQPAHAYLDPGTGSYFFQLLIAGLLGSLFFVRTAIKKIKALFKDTNSRKVEQNSDHDK